MAEQRVDSLLDALEGHTRSLLERLAREREARRHAESVQGELAQRLGELERRLAEVQAAQREIAEEHRGLEEAHRRLEEECRELKQECRELDEQNGELEAHNRHLNERLTSGQPAEGGFRPGRRSQGLSALIGHRPAAQANTAASAPAEEAGPHSDDSSHPSRSSAIHRAMDAPPSPICRTTDTSGSYQAEAPDAAKPPVGARFIGGDEEPQVPAEASNSLETGEPPSPQALLGQWYQRYPAAFFKGHTRPLMVGIHEVLASHEPWPEKLVRRALACYVNLPRYLKAMREDAERIDLDGQPAGKVDAQAADYAHRKLDRLQGEKRAGKGRNSQSRSHQGRGKPVRAGGQGKGKPKKGQGGGPGQATRKPAHERAEPAPATMEEKLSALMAKHNDR